MAMSRLGAVSLSLLACFLTATTLLGCGGGSSPPCPLTVTTARGSSRGPSLLATSWAPSPNLMLYCPTAEDMNLEHGDVTWLNGGWVQTGDARVSSKTSFNLLGGYVEFDMDLSRTNAGVNTNIYTVSMQEDNCGKACYCDIQDNDSPVCMELDIIENNGNCSFASTWHTVPGFDGTTGCDAGGCAYDGWLNASTFHVISTWSENGDWLTRVDDVPLHVNNYEKDRLGPADRQTVQETMSNAGAAIESSQWQGWVPTEGCCPKGGDIDSSVFSIANLRILAKVQHGPEPTLCAEQPSPREQVHI